jgi:AraC-like DNA-binding protein
MSVPHFTFPADDNKTIITKEESLPYFHPQMHRHSEIQLTWIIEGEGTLVSGATVHSFQSNDIFWIAPNQPHLFENDPSYLEPESSKHVHYLDIYFSVDSQLSSFFFIPEVRCLRNFIARNNMGFTIPKEEVREVSEKMMQIKNTNGFEQFFQFISLLKKIISLDDKLESLSTYAESTSLSENEGLRIATIYHYVMQNYQHPITLEEISNLVYMTPSAFCRFFKKHTQHTLVSFVNHVRISQACKQLLDRKCETIASVAYITGFNSITNFNRVFKSVTKQSPKEYVESHYYGPPQIAEIA